MFEKKNMPLFAKKSQTDFIPQQQGGLLKN